MLRELKQTLHAPGHKDPTETDRTAFEHLLWGYGSAVDCHRGRGFGCSRLGYGISPPWSFQNLHRSGKQTLGGHKQNPVCTRTQEKRSSDTTRD